MDDLLALRHAGAKARPRKAAADTEDRVGIVQEVPQMFADADTAGAQRQRMVFGERALAAERRHDRRFEQFGERLELRPGLSVMDALPGMDHRPLGSDESLGDL